MVYGVYLVTGGNVLVVTGATGYNHHKNGAIIEKKTNKLESLILRI
jgi:hypothetical protein